MTQAVGRSNFQANMPDWKREKARAMRKSPTPTEAAMWEQLRRRAVLDMRWKRQRTMYGYIVDFWCPSSRLVIEVDGLIHQRQVAQDAYRDQVLLSKGIRTLRFTNDQVLYAMPVVLAAIHSASRVKRTLAPAAR